MNDKKYNAMFPTKVDLGRDSECYDCPISPSDSKESKKKKVKVYPSLYIDYVAGLEGLPERGSILIKYEVVGLDKRKDRYTGEKRGSITLEVKALCLPEGEEEDTGSLIDAMFDEDDEAKEKKVSKETDDEDED